MPKLVELCIVRGIPGSGKSTYAQEWVNASPNRFRVNKDSLRQMMAFVDFDPKIENVIHDVFLQQVRLLLSRGKNVIADNTHLTRKSVVELHKIAEDLGNVQVSEVWMQTDLEECLRRNSLRDRKVPEDVIRKMHETRDRSLPIEMKYNRPRASRRQNDALPKAVIVDLDGTLALINDRSPYDASTCDNDHPNYPVINVVKALRAWGYRIIFLSGRERKFEAPSRRFIENHVRHQTEFNGESDVIEYDLFMRETGDKRKDSIIKREIFERDVSQLVNVEFVIDDRPSVCRMWRNELGLTCFQVNDVEF